MVPFKEEKRKFNKGKRMVHPHKVTTSTRKRTIVLEKPFASEIHIFCTFVRVMVEVMLL